jgi:hypothetical protein
MKKRQRRSPAEWQVLLESQRESQLSIADFCRQQELDAKYFSKLKRTFEVQGMTSPKKRFVKLEPVLSSSRVSDAGLVLHHQNSRLALHAGVDASWVADLMKALS